MAHKVVAAFVAVMVIGLGVLSLGGTADAAGVTTHTWMALEAVPRVQNAQLRALLQANIRQVEGGAHFPDSGYGGNLPGHPIPATYGEEAHWPRFSYAYARQIRSDPSCAPLTDPHGPCAARIAHLFGAVAHGIGDEVWDWLFEPQAPDRGERYAPPNTPASLNGMELQMDIVAIGDYLRPTSPDLPLWPNHNRLLGVFSSIGRNDITNANLTDGELLMRVARAGERLITARHHDEVTANQPWLSAHVVTGAGGVDFASKAIAANWNNLWGFLLGHQPPTAVAVTYPASRQQDIPSTGWTRSSFIAGSSGGGASTRIAAVLSSSLAYRPTVNSPNTVGNTLPAGSMTITEVASGDPVPLRSGYPRIVPYSAEAGEHEIDVQPDGDLSPCTEYRVDVTNAIRDANNRPITPYSWTFRTDGCTDPVHRPDAQIRVGDTGAWRGWDVYGTTGAGQVGSVTTPTSAAASFTVGVRNSGNLRDHFTLRGQPNTPGFTVQYFDGDTEVTAPVTAGTYETADLAPGEVATLEARVTPKVFVANGVSLTRLVTATSAGDTSAVDVVKATVVVGQPRALLTAADRAEASTIEAQVAALGPALFCPLQ